MTEADAGRGLVTPDDLAPFAEIEQDRAEAMIADALALALRVAPCLADPELDEAAVAYARAILRGAVLRWNDAGTGAVTQLTAGPFAQTLSSAGRKRLLWPSEINDLASLCAGARGRGRIFTIDTTPVRVQRRPWSGDPECPEAWVRPA